VFLHFSIAEKLYFLIVGVVTSMLFLDFCCDNLLDVDHRKSAFMYRRKFIKVFHTIYSLFV